MAYSASIRSNSDLIVVPGQEEYQTTEERQKKFVEYKNKFDPKSISYFYQFDHIGQCQISTTLANQGMIPSKYSKASLSLNSRIVDIKLPGSVTCVYCDVEFFTIRGTTINPLAVHLIKSPDCQYALGFLDSYSTVIDPLTNDPTSYTDSYIPNTDRTMMNPSARNPAYSNTFDPPSLAGLSIAPHARQTAPIATETDRLSIRRSLNRDNNRGHESVNSQNEEIAGGNFMEALSLSKDQENRDSILEELSHVLQSYFKNYDVFSREEVISFVSLVNASEVNSDSIKHLIIFIGKFPTQPMPTQDENEKKLQAKMCFVCRGIIEGTDKNIEGTDKSEVQYICNIASGLEAACRDRHLVLLDEMVVSVGVPNLLKTHTTGRQMNWSAFFVELKEYQHECIFEEIFSTFNFLESSEKYNKVKESSELKAYLKNILSLCCLFRTKKAKVTYPGYEVDINMVRRFCKEFKEKILSPEIFSTFTRETLGRFKFEEIQTFFNENDEQTAIKLANAFSIYEEKYEYIENRFDDNLFNENVKLQKLNECMKLRMIGCESIIFHRIKTQCDTYFNAVISDTIIDISLLNSIPNFDFKLLTDLVNSQGKYD
ncbi:MAG: hypothetical protein KAG53_03650 [Endozoicomonadaceae bacterium]|nr:hypothetical protein [Endozoicomonadaceae bacterium]